MGVHRVSIRCPYGAMGVPMVSPCHEGVTKGVKKRGEKWGKMGQKWAKRGRKSGNKYTAIDVGVVGISGGPLGVHRRSIGGA